MGFLDMHLMSSGNSCRGLSTYSYMDIFTVPFADNPMSFPNIAILFLMLWWVGFLLWIYIFSILRMSSTMLLLACDIFRSSTCQMIVHCFPLLILFVMHLSYSFSLNPIQLGALTIASRTIGLLVVYNTALFWVLHIAWACCFCFSRFISYIVWLEFYNQLCYKVACAHLPMYAWRKAPGISVTTMYCSSFVHMAHDIIIAPKDTVSEVVYSLHDLLSAHTLLWLYHLFFPSRSSFLVMASMSWFSF